MKLAYLLRDRDAQIRVLAPYDADFVDDLKQIPFHAKEFLREHKTWLVDDEYADLLEQIARRHFSVSWVITEDESVERVRAARASAQRQAPAGTASHTSAQCLNVVRTVWWEEAALGLFPPVDNEKVLQAVYRAQAQRFHPDVAGASSHEAMVRINRAHATLMQRIKGKTA